jgi:hypothetical protein
MKTLVPVLVAALLAAGCGRPSTEETRTDAAASRPAPTPAPETLADAGTAPGAPPVPPPETAPPPPEPAPDADAEPPDTPDAAADAPPPAPVEPAAAFVTRTGEADGIGIAAITLCRSIDRRTCVGETRLFEPGQEVWALLAVTNTTGAPSRIRVAYLSPGADPDPGRGMPFDIPDRETYTTFCKSSKTAAGRYEVVVATESGNVIARAGFQTGDGDVAAATADTPATVGAAVSPGADAAAAPVPAGPRSSTGLGIVSLVLCRNVENRRCVDQRAEFAPGEMVWAFLRVANPERTETEVFVSYVSAGATPEAGQGLVLRVPAQPQYTTYAKASKPRPGAYEVVVAAPDGTVLGRTPFEVR